MQTELLQEGCLDEFDHAPAVEEVSRHAHKAIGDLGFRVFFGRLGGYRS